MHNLHDDSSPHDEYRWLVFQAFTDDLLELASDDQEGRAQLVSDYTQRYPEFADHFIRMAEPPSEDTNDTYHLSEEDISLPIDHEWREEIRTKVPDRLGDYLVIKEIGKGGMGLIYEGIQLSIRRRVAIKIPRLQSKEQEDRFWTEATAAARLQYPNIVQIIGVGKEKQVGKEKTEDLNYLVMQLIKGSNLRSVINRASYFPKATETEKQIIREAFQKLSSIANGLLSDETRPRTVAIIGTMVADALVYASNQRIFHRDIKPENLLIDNSTIWLSDFGLAEMGGAYALFAQEYAAHNGDNSTFANSTSGTPRYLPPEQLLNEGQPVFGDEAINQARARDIYALGVTLYESATLRFAFKGRDRNALIAQKQNEAIVRPRKIDPRIPRDLEAVILKAMNHQPELRYATIEELHHDLQCFLEQRPVRARPLWRVSRCVKFCRRHPLASTLTSLLVGAVIFGLGTRYAADVQARDHALKVQAGVAGVQTLLAQARKQSPWDGTYWKELQASADRVYDLTTNQETKLRQELAMIKGEAAHAITTATLLHDLTSTYAQSFGDADGGTTDDNYLRAFQKAGINVQGLTSDSAPELAKHIRKKFPTVIVDIAASFDHWAIVQRNKPAATQQWRNLVELVRATDPDTYRDELRVLMLEGDLPTAKKKLEAFLSRQSQPGSLAKPTVIATARSLILVGDLVRAESLLRTAYLRDTEDPWLNYRLAESLRYQGGRERLREAIRFYSVARSKRPETAFDLASILEDIGDWEEAAVVLEDLVRLYPSDGIVQAALGRLLKQQGRMAEARSAFHDAKPKLIEAIRLHPEFAAEHNALGVVVQDAGEIDKAISEYREAIRLRPRFAEAHTNLGVVLLGKRQFEDAERECRKAVEVLPTDSSYRCNLATVLHAERRLDDATREVKEAIRLSENYAAAHTNLAVLLADLGRWAEAEKEAVEAIRLNPRVPETHANLGIILRKQGKAKEAIELFRVAVGLNPDDAKWHSNLALCLNDLVKQTQDVKLLPEAESHGRLAVQLGPKIAMAHSHLGVILLSLGQNEEAARSFDEAIRLDSTLTEAWFNLGLANFNLQRFDESVKAFREVTKQDDGNVLSHCFLGRSLHLCGTYADGLIELKRAQTLGGPNTNWSGGLPIAKWIEAAEQFAPFEARISALESGRDNAKDILENLTFAQIYHAKKRYKAAVRHHKAAIASDPIWAKNPALFLKFNAACAAVLGGSGQGKDAATDGDATSQLALRQQALEWLKAELISWSQFAEQVPQEKRPEIASELMKWLNDGDLDTVRDPAKIQLLPVAEREQWQRLWADVKLLTQRLAEKTSK